MIRSLPFTLAALLFWPASSQSVSPTHVVDLLENNSLQHWTTTGGEPVTRGWRVEEGVLHRQDRGGDIITREDFTNYKLTFEWKVAPGANSGVKYRVRKYGNSWLGLEYQILDDDRHPDAKRREGRRKAAALYDVFACNDAKQLKPVGEWNQAAIVVRGSRIEHWLNGRKVLDYDLDSSEWNHAVARSKFGGIVGFARNAKGRILIQDHGDEVWYRKILLQKFR